PEDEEWSGWSEVNDLIDTTEMYLKSIIELEEQSIVPLRARIAERLEHSGPTVSQTVARMERDVCSTSAMTATSSSPQRGAGSPPTSCASTVWPNGCSPMSSGWSGSSSTMRPAAGSM